MVFGFIGIMLLIFYPLSSFQVEYKEYFSGQLFHAVAEAPKEALPHDCRPDFGTAWLMRLKFKVGVPRDMLFNIYYL